ncbi:ATP-binding cassette domain-containing protein [Corynebacterium lujinxingii]|uniref:ATP-binding cassette domain-containing protein n=1 Tax=Corynebacterium lujinxingii TaxID=2763010 RepID=A0A7H0K192_9CORY|nr:ATP-binding cassette domain-containing protein [Corynebacterium lujinxingii]MBC3178518.1 ATP-binding cassette domain-containing protein [Corynebacterium lujinxingii]NNO10550.1 ATP-binding cassette domain-containing protein [Corynebacterium lujinxingii]QNP91058.1 ATP-binding cassette domain-containing protein [Corynebacterium lujinxingii]
MDVTLLEQSLRSHRTVQVVGDSGAGLTTLATQIHREWPGAAVVQQDATAHVSYLRDTVIEEIALGLEQRSTPTLEMLERCNTILTAAGLADLAERNPAQLSGGQTRRLAIAAVAVLQPDVLLLDDPFAGLDPTSCTRIAHLLDTLPSKVVILGTRTRDIDSEVLTLAGGHLTPGAPTPHPLELPQRVTPVGAPIDLGEISATRGGSKRKWWQFRNDTQPTFTAGPIHLSVRLGGAVWLRGDNGAGKTTLLRAMAGLDGNPGLEQTRRVAVSLALQRAADQLAESTVAAFIGDDDAVRALDLDPDTHPLDLPAAHFRLAQLTQVFAQGRPLVLLDEPDVGLDTPTRNRAHALIADGLARGQAVIFTCHDADFAAEVGKYAAVEYAFQ